ncbi:MAG: hypothetical protein HYY09_00085 [Firmicutes bacterium]|nr:hypothetical protein [Bacillota bacterium]
MTPEWTEMGRQNRNNRQNGTALVEVLIAVAVIAAVLFPTFDAIKAGLHGTVTARRVMQAANLWRRAAEEAKAAPYDSLAPGVSSSPSYHPGFEMKQEVTLLAEMPDQYGQPRVKRVEVRIYPAGRSGGKPLAESSFLIFENGP